MKLRNLIVGLMLVSGVTFGQDSTSASLHSKKGEPYLPEAKDWSIGVDATPFLDYLGNFFGKQNPNSAPTFNFVNGLNTIVGKYFVSTNMAYRGILRIGVSNTTVKHNVDKDFAAAPVFPATKEQVTDKVSGRRSFVGIGVGIEKRRGKTRLQGFYGADAFLWLMGGSRKYVYGNQMSATSNGTTTTTTPISTSWTVTPGGDNNFGYNIGYNNPASAAMPSRIVSYREGMTFGIGARAFIGVEYFILPKISLAGEFGWGLGFMVKAASVTKTETTIAVPTQEVGVQEVKGDKGSGFVINTDRNVFGTTPTQFAVPSGALRINFHF